MLGGGSYHGTALSVDDGSTSLSLFTMHCIVGKTSECLNPKNENDTFSYFPNISISAWGDQNRDVFFVVL